MRGTRRFVARPAIVPLPQGRADADAQPGHRQVGDQQVQRDEPGGCGNHEAGRHAPAQEDRADHVGQLRPGAGREQVGHQRARKRAHGMREERHDEMPWLEQVHRGRQAFGVGHVHARGRWDQRRADGDERHVDAAAEDQAGKDGKRVSQQLGHVRFSPEGPTQAPIRGHAAEAAPRRQ